MQSVPKKENPWLLVKYETLREIINTAPSDKQRSSFSFQEIFDIFRFPEPFSTFHIWFESVKFGKKIDGAIIAVDGE